MSPAPAMNERDPLIPAQRSATPLPKLQLAILTYMRLAEPIGFMVIFPFVKWAAFALLRFSS